MNLDTFAPEELDRLVRSLVDSATPTDAFKVLLEGSRQAAPRAAIFLIRQGRIKGWGTVGYGSEPSKLQRNDAGWLAQGAASETAISEAGSVSADLDFGQPPAAEAFGVTVRVLDRPIAILVAERSADESPWLCPLLSMLVRVAELRLDLDLVRRKLKMAVGTPVIVEQEEAVAEEPEAARAEERMDEAAESPLDDTELNAARRNAPGLRRHGELGPTALEILHEAYLHVLAGGDAKLMPAGVLD